VVSMRVEGEFTLSPDLKGVGKPSGQRMRDAYHYALLGGAPRVTTPSEPSNHSYFSAPRKPLGLVWCDSLQKFSPFYIGGTLSS
jgi:hypothetical protein